MILSHERKICVFSKNAKWIWAEGKKFKAQYVLFKKTFNTNKNNVKLLLAAETDYVAYINGKKVAFGQYPNYPNKKFYDEIDITHYCIIGENELKITVRYEGVNTSVHLDNGAGLIFSITENGKEISYSDETTLSGNDGNYIQNNDRYITGQLGFSVDMQTGVETVYKNSVVIDMDKEILPRPVKKLQELPFLQGKEIRPQLYDLGREEAGYLNLDVTCDEDAEITLGYGEWIDESGVRIKIHERNFSFNFKCKKGDNHFEIYFVRLGCRYLQIFGKCKVNKIGIIPVLYPLTEKPVKFNGIEKDVYDVSVRTLRLCMHEHYEDCPWREQALYILDSRNQMKCGYYAFEETDYQRANLLYMLNGIDENGMFNLTFPCNNNNAIPSFSTIYPVSVFEYVDYTGDVSILEETMPAIENMLKFLAGRIDETGLIANPENYWNFYEWVEESQSCKPNEHDLLLNCFYLYAYKHFKKLTELKPSEFIFDEEKLKENIVKNLWVKEKYLFKARLEKDCEYTQLCNAMALLCGLGNEQTLQQVKECKGLTKATLSMQCFVYDALLEADENNKKFVLEDIKKTYSYMLNQGATSFWETIDGNKAFDYAGSLCHGWSALPAYYYNIFNK